MDEKITESGMAGANGMSAKSETVTPPAPRLPVSPSAAAPSPVPASASPALPASPPIPPPGDEAEEREAKRLAEREIRGKSRRSFLWAAGIATGAVLGIRQIDKLVPESDSIPSPLRKMLGFNEVVAQRLFYSPRHRSKEYPRSAAVTPHNNYKGDTPKVDLEKWRLALDGMDGGKKSLTIGEIRSLPRVEQTTEFHCVEGWSCIVTWAGARMIDFLKKYPPPPGTRYVAMLSEPEDFPDERYYVGLDLASCLHPQSLLAYEMNGETLDVDHGAPLRLVMPHKYGIKNIKLITTIAYTAIRPADYWAEQGYDYYAGL